MKRIALLKVMYVEDDIDVRDAMVRLMEMSGMIVETFVTVESAIKTLSNSDTYDIILSDQQLLGRLTGVDLISWAKHHTGIPCMMLTATDNTDKLLAAAGITDVTVFMKGRSRPSEVIEAMQMIA
jgi:DNA-binding NtrC family response regulator